MKRKAFLFGLLMVSLTMMGQSKLSSSSRLLIERVKSDETVEARSITRSMYPMSHANDVEYVNAFIYLEKKANLANLEALGVYVENDFDGIITARIPVNMLEQVSELEDVKYVEVGTVVQTKMRKARAASHVDEVHAGTSLSRPFYGEGVVVGVVDYGFDYTHLNFRKMGDTDSLRIKRVWNQNRNSGTPPSGFSSGREYATQSDILTAKYDNQSDKVGHGSHVAGIAAGSDTIGGFTNYGVAPKSDLVFVSYNASDYSGDNVSIANGVKYVFDYAASVNKPAVVNLSLGSHIGPHDGTSTFDKLIDQMSLDRPGRVVVGACGNEGGDDLHLKKTFTEKSQEVKTSLYFASTSGYSNYKVSWLDVWGDVGTDYTIRVSVYKKSSMEETWTTGDINASVTASKTLTVRSSGSTTAGASGTVKYAAGKESNGKNHVQFDIQLSSLSSGHYVVVIIGSKQGVVNAWTDGQYSIFASNSLSGYVGGNTNLTVGEIGGTANKIIAVGAYSVDNHYRESVGSIASFSSVGPTADGRIKPDVVAPGTAIISSVPSTSAIRNGGYYENGGSHTVNGTEYLYSYMQGTSMASPYVAGVVALWLEANPNMGPDRVREILAATSIQDNFTGTCPNNRAGYGKINALDGILKAIEISGNDNLELLPDAIVAYPNPNDGNFRVLFTQHDPNLTISVYNMSGQEVYTQRVGVVSEREEVSVSMGNIADGAYIIKVKGDNINESFRLMIKK